MSDEHRKKEDLELLRRSRRALEDEQKNGPSPTAPPRSEPPSDGQMMYRGRPVGRAGSGPRVPGSGGGRQRPAGQFRGAQAGARSGRGGSDDIKSLLQKLSDLRAAGLITQAEYDKKRSQILDRL